MTKAHLVLVGSVMFLLSCAQTPSREVAAAPVPAPTKTKVIASEVDDSPHALRTIFDEAQQPISFNDFQDQIEYTIGNPYPPRFVFSGVSEFHVLQPEGSIGFNAYNYKQFLYKQQCYVSGKNLKTKQNWETRPSFVAKITPQLFEKFKKIRKSMGSQVDEGQHLTQPALISTMHPSLNERPITVDTYLEAAAYTKTYQASPTEIVFEVTKPDAYTDLKTPMKITFRKAGEMVIGQITNEEGVVGYKWCAPTNYTYCYTNHISVESDRTRVINVVSVAPDQDKALNEIKYELGLVDKDGERCFPGAYDGKTSDTPRCVAHRAAGAKIRCSKDLNSLNIKADTGNYKLVNYYTR